MNNDAFIKVENLHKSYGPEIQVLKGLDLSMTQGDRIVVIGPSGGGKSTLLRCLMGLEKIDQGKIIFDDKAYIEANPNPQKGNLVDKSIRNQIGMVFQHYTLFPHLTILGNLILAPVKSRHESKQVAIKRAIELLERLGLGDKPGAYPSQLSGGQKQRAAIARALMLEPKLLLFDEVTSALDPELVTEVETVMLQLAEQDMPMMIVTHDMWFARNIATSIIFCAGGKIVEQGPPEVMFRSPKEELTKKFLKQIRLTTDQEAGSS